VWFAPWEDNDGDMHDQSYVYLPIDNGKWLIEHNRRRIQDAYRPVRAPSFQTSPTSNSQNKIKVTPPSSTDSEDGSRQSTQQSSAEFMNGILRPGTAGSPAQSADN